MRRWHIKLRPTVLQLIDSFHQGGSESQAVQLTRLLHGSGRFAVRLASLSSEGPLRSEAEALKLGEIPSFPLRSFYDHNALLQLRRLVALLRRWRIDVLNTHDFYTNVFGMAAGWLARVPARIASMRETDGLRTGAQRSAQRFAYAMAHHLIANSQAVGQELIAQGVKGSKISVVYNGLDLKRLETGLSPAEALAVLRLPPETDKNRKRVTIVANMRHDVKDHPMFLRAAQVVKESVPEAEFLLAGEGELAGYLQSLASQLGIHGSTYFLGRCDNVAALLQVSDVCVLSSKAEGFSNAILEYMAAARPVVATAVGGAGEVICEGQTGYLVNSGDHQSMAERIVSLLRDLESARAMGQRGQKLVEEKFSCAVQLRRIEDLYDKLLNRRTASQKVVA